MSDALLTRIYEQHYPDDVDALHRFDTHLASLELPFDLKRQVHGMPYPAHRRRREGIPPFIYYFVPNSGRGSIVGHEHQTAPQIDAVIFRSMLPMTHVLARDVRVHHRIKRLLAVPILGDFPLNYMIPFNMEAQKNRVAKRAQTRSSVGRSKVFHWMIKPQGPHRYPPIEPDLYRLDIRWGLDGEPGFRVIPNPK